MTDLNEGVGSGGDAAEFFVPSKESTLAAVKAFEQPTDDFVKLPDNLAGDDELAKKVHDVSYDHYTRFKDSAARKDLDTYLKDADAKWRLARNTANRWRTGSKQKQSTLSHVSSGQFYNTVRLITAGERSIVFNDPTSLPAEYVADIKSEDFTENEGKRVQEGQQLYAQYVWGKEELEQWVKNTMLFTNKNSMSYLELTWQREVDTRPERVVGYYDANGDAVEWKPGDPIPTANMFKANGKPLELLFDPESGVPLSYVFVDKTRVIREWPVPVRHDAKDFFCDLELKDTFLRDQTCTVIRKQMSYKKLLDEQRNDKFINVENLTTAQLYKGEAEQDSEVERKRYENADQTKDDLTNGLFDVFFVRMISPIDHTKKTPKWDDKAIGTIHEAVYVGDYGKFASGDDPNGAICLMVRKDPYHYKKRFMVFHSHEDEKGLVRLGYFTILECIIEEMTVIQDQLIDNKTLAVKSPMVAELGNVLSRDLVFRDGNQVIWVERGTGQTALTKMSIPDMTQRFVEEYRLFKGEAEELAGITDALRGEFAGSRTTGTEYLGAREQSAKPAIEDAKQKYKPFFSWLFLGMAELGRQFGNPAKMLIVTDGKGAHVGDVNPTHLYGELGVTVSSIDNFEADLQARQVMVNFIQAGGYDKMLPFMGQEGAMAFWKDWTKIFKMRNANKYLPASTRIVEAEIMAEDDYKKILLDPIAAMQNNEIFPRPGEQHDIQIAILTGYLKKWKFVAPTLPDPTHAKNVIQALNLFIQMHEDLKAQAAPGAEATGAEQAQAPMQAQETPAMGGEAAGDIVSGVAGQIAEGV